MRPHFFPRLCTSALALSLALAGTAHAEAPSKAGTKAEAGKKERAQQHLRAGNVAFDKGDYPVAVSELEASYAEVPDPAVMYALGQAHRLNGDCTKAAEAYRAFLDSNPPERQREAAQGNLERCEASSSPAAAAAETPPPAETAPPPEQKTTAPLTATEPPPAETDEGSGHAWYADVPGHILTGTGVAAAIVGTILFTGGRSKVSDADSAGTIDDFDASRDDAHSGLTQQRVGLVVMGAGGALIIGGVIRYATVGGGPKDTAGVRIGPTLGGVLATGTF
jgi:hypothetical protein